MKSTSLESPKPQMKLFFNGDEYFQAIFQDIRQAKFEILLESYIFDMDAIGLQVINELEIAHRRGVVVRILVDGIGSFNWMTQLRQECKKRSLSLRVYHPLPLQFVLFRGFSWRSIRKLLFISRRSNKRNHRKTVIIDRQIAFVGSQNISQVHSERFMGAKAWRDTAVRAQFETETQDIELLRSAFLNVWSKSGRLFSMNTRAFLRPRKRNARPSGFFRLNSRLDWRFSLLRDLVRRINLAEKRVLVTNAYFLPRRSVLSALRRAARRGVYVGLCLPEKTDVWVVREASRSLFHRMLKDGVHIFEYKPRVMHAKTLVIDDWATVGSHNMNHRSFIHDLEVDAVVTQPELIEQLVNRWDQDIGRSEVITKASLGMMSIWRRELARVIYWFRYWL